MTDKNSVADWSTTATDNDNIAGVPLAENQMYPRHVNNAIRTIMAQVKAAYGGTAVSAFIQTLLDDADASTAQTTLGISTFIKTLLDDADAATARTTLGVAIGTDVQGYDAQLAALAGLTGAAGSFVRWTGAATAVMQTIVGTVSQTSSVPTGAIIESGSNANGVYVRFADGTQLCQGTATLTTILTSNILGGTWTFPAAFISAPAVIHLLNQGVIADAHPSIWDRFNAAAGGTTTGTSCGVRTLSAGTWVSGDTMTTNAFALGRWF